MCGFSCREEILDNIIMADDSGSATKSVGPYLLQRTLGKGQTGTPSFFVFF